MAWTDLKAAVAAVIKTNGNQEITGAVLQSTLNSIIDQVGANSTFKGIATPSTSPGTPDGKELYFAYEPGIYPNFSGIEITDESIYLFSNSTGSWQKIRMFKDVSKTKYLNTFGVIPSLVDTGKYINLSGALVNLATYDTSDYIRVKNGSSVYISEDNSVGEAALACALYNTSKVFVKEIISNEIIDQDGYVRFCGENTQSDYYRVYYDAISDLFKSNSGEVLIQELDLKRNIGDWIAKDSGTTLTYSDGVLNISNTVVASAYKGAYGGAAKLDSGGVKYLAVFEAKRNTGTGDWYLTMSQIGGDSSKLTDLDGNWKRYIIELEVLETSKRILLYSPNSQIQDIDIRNFYYVRDDSSEYERLRFLKDLQDSITALESSSATIDGKTSKAYFTDLPNYGYLNTSGVFITGPFGHYTSGFIKVDSGDIIKIANASVGGLAILCAFYTTDDETDFVSSLSDGNSVPSEGYIRFCGQVYDDESFAIQRTVEAWNKKITALESSSATIDGKTSKAYFTDLPNYGYLNTSGVFISGPSGHYTSGFIKVDLGDIIKIANASVGGLAILCAFYTTDDETDFVSSLSDGNSVSSEGYIRFCGQVYDDESFAIQRTVEAWNKKIVENSEPVVITGLVEKVIDTVQQDQIVREISDILSPDWKGKAELRDTDIEPSINTKGQSYLYDNGGTIELRIVKDAESIVTIPISSTITPLSIIPFTGTWYARGDSITYGVGATTKYIDRVVNLLTTDGHTITVTNAGISGQDAQQLYNNNVSSPASAHDIASLMIGINDIEHWVANNSIGVGGDLLAEDFRDWYRTYLNLLIDIIISQTGCSKFFLIVPTPQVIDYVDPNYLPTQNRYVANPLMQIVIQECIRAYSNRKDDGIVKLCRGDYYLKDATTTEISDRIHPNDTGATLLAKGIRDEMTYRI